VIETAQALPVDFKHLPQVSAMLANNLLGTVLLYSLFYQNIKPRWANGQSYRHRAGVGLVQSCARVKPGNYS
jgi:hypothetical protein